MDISVIIPVYNSAKFIPELINSLLHQDFRGKYEIIIVDDGSTDTTKEIFMRKIQKFVYVKQDNKGPAAARNTGLKIASGKIVAFTDSDCIPDRKWLSEIKKSFVKGVSGVEGKTVSTGKIYPDSHYIKNLSGRMYVTSNMAFIKSKIKFGFDENFKYPNREDSDIAFRLITNGEKIVFNDKVVVKHRMLKYSLSNMIRRKLFFESDVILFKKYPKLYKKFIKFPFGLFMPGYLIFSLFGFFNSFVWLGLILTALLEIVYRRYSLSVVSFIKFLIAQTVGSFVNICVVLNGFRKYKVNPIKMFL